MKPFLMSLILATMAGCTTNVYYEQPDLTPQEVATTPQATTVTEPKVVVKEKIVEVPVEIVKYKTCPKVITAKKAPEAPHTLRERYMKAKDPRTYVEKLEAGYLAYYKAYQKQQTVLKECK